jgi:Alpha/beta hydrolase domain
MFHPLVHGGNSMSAAARQTWSVSLAVAVVAALAWPAQAQPPVGVGPGPGPGGRGGPPQFRARLELPDHPTAVTLPTLSAEIKGPGPMFDSAPSQMPGLDLEHFDYETHEYFVSGTADGRPYTTRVVVRRPHDDKKFSGLVLAESMHSSGAAHAFEFTAPYVMDSGHAAVEILTTSRDQFVAFNAERYKNLAIEDGQANDILAQVGALVKSGHGPLGRLKVRKTVMSGSSMSSGTLINYLPAHMVYRTPDMQDIYDGFIPTSAGQTIMDIDVPLIQMPTMLEAENNVPRRQDSDEPGKQYRLYEFAGIGHVDSRNNIRFVPNPCVQELSTFPSQAYMSVGLYHLMRWVDRGISPPHAERIWLDRNTANDGSMMATDAHGNGLGGIRSPYVDVPVARYAASSTAREPLIERPSAWIAANGGLRAAQLMCRLSAYQVPFPKTELRDLYGTKDNYVRLFAARLDDLERQGWSLPLYHDVILGDAKSVDF